MEDHGVDKRREPRFAIGAGTVVEVFRDGRTVRATTVNISGCGVLLQLDEPIGLAVGDQVICEFSIPAGTDKPLPCWAVGDIVRIDDCRVAIDFKAGGFVSLDLKYPQRDIDTPVE